MSVTLIAVAVPAARARWEASAPAAPARYWADVAVGLRYLARDRPILVLCAVAALVNMLGSPLFVVVLPVFADHLYGAAAALGLLLGGFGAGLLAGSLLFGAVGHRLPRLATLAGGLAGTGLPLAGLAPLPGLPGAAALLALAGMAGGPFNPLVFTLLQERVPEDLRGRIFAQCWAARWQPHPLGCWWPAAWMGAGGLRGDLLPVAAASWPPR